MAIGKDYPLDKSRLLISITSHFVGKAKAAAGKTAWFHLEAHSSRLIGPFLPVGGSRSWLAEGRRLGVAMPADAGRERLDSTQVSFLGLL